MATVKGPRWVTERLPRLDGRAGAFSLARGLLRRNRYIFLFSHERSYSTLFGHLLGSHPEVTGYAEQHRSYFTDDDLAESCCEVWARSGHRLDGRYIFDKLLHDSQQISDEILHRPKVYPVYGLREPIATVQSLVAMGRRTPTSKKNKRNWRAEPDTAARHLFHRYASILELSERRDQAAVVFTDAIVSDTRSTLDSLSDHLGLRSPIRDTYDSFSKTGVGKFGDPMGPIASGAVQADRPQHDVEVSDELAERLWDAYAHAAAELTRRCSTVIGTPVTR